MVALWSAPPSPLLVEDLTAFAVQAAVVLELADRRLEAEQGAVLADRDRIGRDLHDLVSQRLFATGVRLQGALRLIVDAPAAARYRLGRRRRRSPVDGGGRRPGPGGRVLAGLDLLTRTTAPGRTSRTAGTCAPPRHPRRARS